MSLLRALIIEEDKLRRLYLRLLLQLMRIDSVVARDGNAARRHASPFAIDLIVCRQPPLLKRGDSLGEIIKSGDFGDGMPCIVIADYAEASAVPENAEVCYLADGFWPTEFFKAVKTLLDADQTDKLVGTFRRTQT